ncbi:MAG: hypothetical protein ACRYF5_11345, partial [Janthinobacterium lividum]
DGQQWNQMMANGSGGYVDSTYDSTKKNILICWEGTNAINIGGISAAQAFAQAQAYTAERLSIHPGWLIVHMTLLPIYYQQWSDATAANVNAVQNAYSNMLRDGWKAMGAKAIIDVQQAGSVFRFSDYNKTTFQAANIGGQSIWSPNDQYGGGGTGQNQWVHPSNVGYTQIAQIAVSVVRRLPAR